MWEQMNYAEYDWLSGRPKNKNPTKNYRRSDKYKFSKKQVWYAVAVLPKQFVYFQAILLISQTKLDSSLSGARFYITGYTSPYRLDRNKFKRSIHKKDNK